MIKSYFGYLGNIKMNFKMVGRIDSKAEAEEIQQIAKVHLIGQRAKELGFLAWTEDLCKEGKDEN